MYNGHIKIIQAKYIISTILGVEAKNVNYIIMYDLCFIMQQITMTLYWFLKNKEIQWQINVYPAIQIYSYIQSYMEYYACFSYTCFYLKHIFPNCISPSTIWGAKAACLLLILFASLLYFTLCKSRQLFPSACMNQCLSGDHAGVYVQLNNTNLCFNYDDLLSVPAACTVLYTEFHCLHKQMVN